MSMRSIAKTDIFHKVIAQGMWGGALISAVLGTELPGPGTIYINQSLHFCKPVGLGDTVTVRVTVREKLASKKRVVLDCVCSNQTGDTVIEGEAEVIAPSEKVRRPRTLLPEVHLHEHGAAFQLLIATARKLEPIKTAMVHPCDEASLVGAIDAMREGLIVPVLVGPRSKIEKAAKEAKLSLGSIEVVDVPAQPRCCRASRKAWPIQARSRRS